MRSGIFRSEYHLTHLAVKMGLLALLLLSIAGCSEDDTAPLEPVSTGDYLYSGFFLNVEEQNLVRISDGTPDGKILVTPGAIRQRVTFGFLDSEGKTVETPPDSIVVVLTLKDNSRISILPGSLPDPVFHWTFSLGADRIGATELVISFLPEGICRETSVTVQAVG